MKKLITLCILSIFSFALKAQSLSGTQTLPAIRGGASCYTVLNWKVNYQFIEKDGAFYLSISNPSVSVANNSLYGSYSKSDLGLSVWPDSDPKPYNFSVEVTIIYPGGSLTTRAQMDPFTPGTSIGYLHESKFKNLSVSSFKVTSAGNMYYNGGRDGVVDKLIEEKKYAANNANNTQSTSQSSSSTSSTSTNTQQKINQNDPNPMTNGSNGNYQAPKSEYQKNYETGQQIGQLANDVVDIFSKSPERLAREEAERKLKDAEKTEDLESFKKSLSLYIKGASNGNEKDRMRLIDLLIYYNYYKKRDYRAYIPEYKNWLFEAANNKNLIAMNIIGWESINLFGSSGRLDFGLTREQAINILEESADLGSLDAMILLGKYYEWNKCLGNLGGNDPDKALKWFNLAAQNNSPSGYYHLGMIYSYPKGRSCLVNYKMKKNYLLAKEYFLKGTELEESESLTIYNGNPKRSSYGELYFIYNEGKGCDKNPELAKKYLNLFKN